MGKKNFIIFFLMLLFTSSFLIAHNYTEDDFYSRIELISLMRDDASRLSAYDQLSQSLGIGFLNAYSQSSDKWEVKYSIDVMDDTENVVFKLYEDDPEDKQNKIYLILEYIDGVTSIKAESDNSLLAIAEQIRFGSNSPEEIKNELRGFSSGHTSFTIYYISEMLKYDKVMISFRKILENNKIRIATFDTSGLKEAIEPYDSILNWL